MIRWLPAIALGLLAAWLAYGRSARGAAATRGARTWGLAALRALAVMLVAALLLGAPIGAAKPREPLVALDASASWRRANGDDSTVARAWRRVATDSVLARVSGGTPVVLVGDSLREVLAGDVNGVMPRDGASRVRPAVDLAASQGRSLLLFTDGAVDDPDALAEAPPGSRVVRMAMPPRADVGVADLTAPAAMNVGDTVTVAVTVAAGGVATADGTLTLRLAGNTMASVPVPALSPYASSRLSARLTVPRGDSAALLQAVLGVAGDVEPRNDTLAVAVTIGDRPSAVFVSTAPDLDVREVLTVLRGALDVPTRAYLRLSRDVWRVEGSYAPISEAEVRARAADAGVLIVHGDTTWRPASTRATARAMWVPAPPTQVARAGELTRTPEWYAAGVPASPLMAALAALPLDSLPPVTLAGAARGGDPVLTMQLGKRGEAVPAIAARELAGARSLVISGSGYAGWSLRAGRSREAFTALWGAIFDWLAAGRGDQRAARPLDGVVREGEAIGWRRGGVDTVVRVRLTRRVMAGDATGSATDSVTLRFSGNQFETTSPALTAGVYDVEAPGGRSLLVVNPSREWVPRAPTVAAGPLARGTSSSDAPILNDFGWPFALALLLLCAEWIARRAAGQR